MFKESCKVLPVFFRAENAPRCVCMMGCCVKQRGDALERLLVFITPWTLRIESISPFYQIRARL